jgi:cold shock CspA family protein
MEVPPEITFRGLEKSDEIETHIHKNAVLHTDFERLEIGTGVRYFPSEGEEGPQASTVQIVDKPGSRASKVEEPHVEQPEGWKS